MTNYFYIILPVSCVEYPVSTWLLMLSFYCSHFIHDGNGKLYTTCWILQFHKMVHLSTLLWLDNILSIHSVLVLLAHLFLFYLLSYLLSLLLFFFTPYPITNFPSKLDSRVPLCHLEERTVCEICFNSMPLLLI